jgi:hypothetical protein
VPIPSYAGRSALRPLGASPQPRAGAVGSAWLTAGRRPWLPGGTESPGRIRYQVYGNTGSPTANDPINYTTPLAAVDALSWVTPPLSYPGDWRLGVRAYDSVTGLEELNLDAAVEIILDSAGNDISNRPLAPIGLRAFPTS